ncbi:hypothetical protein J3R83DRAFT_9148 [Lanmaoa asiatica]|nr:hypothetical protein J3R83DRAFT_9148 [Lanmaoa asiatica]
MSRGISYHLGVVNIAFMAARMSVMFSLIKIVSPSVRMRSITGGFTVLFFLLWALCISSKAYTCAAIEFTTDVASAVILVALPTWILWRMRLRRNERILMFSVFTMSLLSVVVSIVHVAFLIPTAGFMAGMTADIEGALDLTICNLLVLVTGLYRFFRDGEDIENIDNSPSSTAKPPESPSLRTAMDTLTTVDLERFETMSIHSTQSTQISQPEMIPMHNISSRSCFDISVEHA